MTLGAGTHLGRYEIRAQIGAGGMGEVYLAQDTELERAVALKILPAEVTGDQQRMNRFVQEAKAASALNHQNIITIHEIGRADSARFIVMEFIDGETLRQHLTSSRMNLPEVLDIAIQIASALSAAHQAGIAHRDLKPDNVMVRRDGHVKVLDFGLAKLTERQSLAADTEAPTRALVNTGPGVIMGTTAYMSPEQARGQEVDTRTDVWSLGVLLYEMVTGKVPFAGSSTNEIISAILSREQAAPLARFAHDIPDRLEEIVTKALTKDREERYQHVKDLLIDLKRLKQKLEVEAEIERSVTPDLRTSTATATPSGNAAAASTREAAAQTRTASVGHPTTSAEYIVSGIKRHKTGAITGLAALVMALAVAGYFYFGRGSGAAIDSIAVLPFENRSADPDTEYLSDGLAESLIYRLSQLPNLKVSPRSSVFRYKGRETDPIKVGGDLGVSAVLSGRITQRGDSLIISAELTDVRYNKLLWGEQYERRMSDLLQTQREIAREIVEKLKVRVTSGERAIAKHYTESNEAYQSYLKGRFYWNKRNAEAFKKSIEYFNQAIERDPNFALAYAGLADTYVLLPIFAVGSPQESFPKAKAAAKRALEIDDTLAEAHTSLAFALFKYDWNLAESNREFQRAIELNPAYATAHQWYGHNYLAATGRFDEAIAEAKRAQELDPLSLIINADLGANYIFARQYDKAIEQLRKTLELDQSFYYARWRLGTAYEMKGSFREAIPEYQKARQLNDDPQVLALLGHAYAASGKRDEALRMLDQLKEISRQRYVSAYSFALVYAGLGEKDQAFQWLEQGYRNRDWQMAHLKVDPMLDNLRSDRRFADLLRRIGLPQ